MSDPPRVGPADWPDGLAQPVHVEQLRGGWVGRTERARLADGQDVVIKMCPYPARVEVDGFAALAAAGVPVPAVLGWSARTIVTQWVAGPPDWSSLGTAIAQMHSCTAERFGWHMDNRAGRFVQHNEWAQDWPTFFTERRVLPHLCDRAIPAEMAARLRRACDGPIQAVLPARPAASLTHGDLWLGNIVGGRWIIDPEVSYADRELDLTNMLSSADRPLPGRFWAAYRELLPFGEGFQRRRTVLGLHHRLLQVRHFGPGHLAGLDADLRSMGC